MRMKRVLSLCLIAIFIMAQSSVFAASGNDTTALGKISLLEKIYFGSAQTGPFVDRVIKLEKSVMGNVEDGVLLDRIDTLYAYTKVSTSSEPSFLVKLNCTEWQFNHAITNLSVKDRLENLEKHLFGEIRTDSFDSRLDELMELAFTSGMLNVGLLSVPQDTLIKIRTLSKVDSAKNKVGDYVAFKVLDDVYLDDYLAIPAGTQGRGRLTEVKPRGNFGRDAKVNITFESVEALDGTIVKTLIGDKAKEQTKSLAFAAGASVAGLAILGPVGIVGGAFVHGQEVVIPTGTDMYIQTAETVEVYGVQMK